jgi:putative membrane protein
VGETPEELFTDPRIAAVASVSNFNEIEPSQVALERAQAQQLKDYARLMIDHHTRLEQGARALLDRKGVRPEDNALSLQLKRNLPPTLDMLRARSGRDFDAAYALQQIQSHDLTLKTLDTSLIPAARDPELKALLRDTVRPLVVDHLNRIMAIHHQMLGLPPAPAAR